MVHVVRERDVDSHYYYYYSYTVNRDPEDWQDGLEVRTLASRLSSLGSIPDPAINCQSVFHRQGDSSIRVPSLRWTLNRASILPAFVGGH